LTATLLQPGKSNAYFGLEAYTGPLGGVAPTINAQARLVGFELDTVGDLVPSGTAQAIGGSAFDTAIKAAVDQALLDVSIRLTTIANHTLALNIGGTPAEPEFDKSAVLFNVFGRGFGTAFNIAGNATDMGMAAAGTTLKTAGNLGKDTGKAVTSLGKGLFKTAQSAAKGDIKEAAKDLGGTGKGLVTDTASAVTDTGKGLASGVGEAGSAAVGGKHATAWRTEVWQRWTNQWQSAQAGAAGMPYPPQRLRDRWASEADTEAVQSE
jgi:hypothetical protein